MKKKQEKSMYLYRNKKWEVIGHCPVDSGQLMIVDPCYIDTEWKKVKFNPEGQPSIGLDYDACCHATLSKSGAGQIRLAVASGTVNGDGQYLVRGLFADRLALNDETQKYDKVGRICIKMEVDLK